MTFAPLATVRGSQVVLSVKLEREDEEDLSPHVVAPFFPQVRKLANSKPPQCTNKLSAMISSL